jgi:hypothetical protein
VRDRDYEPGPENERRDDPRRTGERDPGYGAAPHGATMERSVPARESRYMQPDQESKDLSSVQQPPAHASFDALFTEEESGRFRTRWEQIQATFVDEPHRAVERADQLVKEVTTLLAEVFAHERQQLEQQWHEADDVSTEDLRLALRRYRSFFDRLLAV